MQAQVSLISVSRSSFCPAPPDLCWAQDKVDQEDRSSFCAQEVESDWGARAGLDILGTGVEFVVGNWSPEEP